MRTPDTEFYVFDSYNQYDGENFVIGAINADTPDEFGEDDGGISYSKDLIYFETLSDCLDYAKLLYGENYEEALADGVIKASQTLADKDLAVLSDLAGAEIKREEWDATCVASLCTQIEAYGSYKGVYPGENKRLAEMIVRLEEFVGTEGEALDTVKDIRIRLVKGPKKVLKFVEGIGRDLFDEERSAG